MATIGYATLQIIPSLRGVSEAIDKEMRGKTAKVPVTADEQAARRSGQRAGKQLSDAVQRETRGLGRKIGDAFDPSIAMGRVGKVAGTALKGALLGGVAGVGAAIAGTVGGALFKGFERLKSIDDATAKLKALGNSAGDVQKIMDSALESVKGTSFGLGDAATVAANAVAAGVKPGQDLTKYLKTTADAAAIAGTELGDMGRIINQVHTGQKAYTEDLNQLADRGVPIYQWLSEQLHISAADVKQFAADGKISSADFEAAIQTHIGGAALTMGTSFSGAVQNAEAAVGRLGAAFLQPVFGNAAGGIGSITDGLDGLTAWVDAHQDTIIGFWEGFGTAAIRAAENVTQGVGGMLQAIGDIAGGVGNIQGTILKFESFQARVRGDYDLADELHRQSEEAFGWGESIRVMGDKLANVKFDDASNKVRGWAASARDANDAAHQADGSITGLGNALGALAAAKDISVHLIGIDEATRKMTDLFNLFRNPPPVEVRVAPGSDALAPGFFAPPTPGRASGGPINGRGGPKSDIIPIWASNGEHMLSAADVNAMGGQAGVYAFRNALHRQGGGWIFPLRDPRGSDPRGGSEGDRSLGPFAPWWNMDWLPPEHPEKIGPSMPGVEGKWWHQGPTRVIGGIGAGVGKWFPPLGKLRPWGPDDPLPPDIRTKMWGFAGGGAISPDVQAALGLVGTSYNKENRTDCSGMVARVIDGTLGLPNTGLMSTKNAADWLAARGFKKGIGGPGTISVGWYDHGPNPNDGHMAMTLSNGQNAEAGGGVGDIFQVGGGAAGASSPEFDQHMYLATVYGEGAAGSSAASSPFAGGSAAAAATAAPASSSGGGTSSSSSGGGSTFNFPSSFKELAGLGLAGMGITTKVSPDTPDRTFEFGDAAAEAVGGQVDSLLNVFGVGGSPGWLQGISKLIGGIKIGGDSSADPLSATSNGTGTSAPDDHGNMHGRRAGQQPGPVYNITARDTEDAFIKAQRLEREKSAAKLSRF